MINTKFEAYKVKRELKRSGRLFDFYRHEKNEFGEPTKDAVKICSIVGLLHSSKPSSFIDIRMNNDVQIREKYMHMILCCTEDLAGVDLQPGDQVVIDEVSYKFIKTIDVQNWGVISDISIEEVDNG